MEQTIEKQEQASSPFTFEVDTQGIGVLTFAVPGSKPNTLSIALFESLPPLMETISKTPNLRAIVFRSGKPDMFIAGADLEDLVRIPTAAEATRLSSEAHKVMARFEEMHVPIVCAIHGMCMGGGTELALACHYRVATDDPKTVIALPEVKLGLLPGAGGCQRLPRLVGLLNALDMILPGKNVYPKKALQIGLVDEVCPNAILLDVAKKAALGLAEGRIPRKRAPRTGLVKRLLFERNPIGRNFVFKKAAKRVLEQTKGCYPAPLKALEAIRAAVELPVADGFKREAELFGEVASTDIAKGLIGLFFATREANKEKGADVTPRAVRKIGILGAGFMGSGIAQVAADKGYVVRFKDRDDAALGKGMRATHEYFTGQERTLGRHEAARRRQLVSGSTTFDGWRTVDFAIEAVFEDLELKRKVLAEFEAATRDDAIFASNTSSLPITEIAAGAKRPDNVVGMHFFSPVPKMPLVEVIRGKQTSDDVLATTVELSKRLGKTVIVVNDGVGFYTSRILGPYMNEAGRMLLEGIAIDALDRALEQFGFPVGPIVLMDEVGIDIAAHVGKILRNAFGERMAGSEMVEKMVAAGRMGRKNQKGFYLYKKGKKLGPDTSVYALLPGGAERKPIPAEEAVDRLVYAMANEAARCLEEGILRSANDGDVGAVLGLGFPPFRGGPFRWMDKVGLPAVVGKLEALAAKHGPRFKPAQILVDMARSGRRFHLS